jgi:hypothetical protein
LVDAQDEKAFRNIAGFWLHQSSLNRKWWWSLRVFPVRGWILQQVIKIAITQVLDIG